MKLIDNIKLLRNSENFKKVKESSEFHAKFLEFIFLDYQNREDIHFELDDNNHFYIKRTLTDNDIDYTKETINHDINFDLKNMNYFTEARNMLIALDEEKKEKIDLKKIKEKAEEIVEKIIVSQTYQTNLYEETNLYEDWKDEVKQNIYNKYIEYSKNATKDAEFLKNEEKKIAKTYHDIMENNIVIDLDGLVEKMKKETKVTKILLASPNEENNNFVNIFHRYIYGYESEKNQNIVPVKLLFSNTNNKEREKILSQLFKEDINTMPFKLLTQLGLGEEVLKNKNKYIEKETKEHENKFYEQFMDFRDEILNNQKLYITLNCQESLENIVFNNLVKEFTSNSKYEGLIDKNVENYALCYKNATIYFQEVNDNGYGATPIPCSIELKDRDFLISHKDVTYLAYDENWVSKKYQEERFYKSPTMSEKIVEQAQQVILKEDISNNEKLFRDEKVRNEVFAKENRREMKDGELKEDNEVKENHHLERKMRMN